MPHSPGYSDGYHSNTLIPSDAASAPNQLAPRGHMSTVGGGAGYSEKQRATVRSQPDTPTHSTDVAQTHRDNHPSTLHTQHQAHMHSTSHTSPDTHCILHHTPHTHVHTQTDTLNCHAPQHRHTTHHALHKDTSTGEPLYKGHSE